MGDCLGTPGKVLVELIGGQAVMGAFSLGGGLTVGEQTEIQAIANEFNTQIDVVGSRAGGVGRNVGTQLPVGKGPGNRSDIDFRISGEDDIRSGGALSGRLQQVGSGAGSVVSSGLPEIPSGPGPVIRFLPGP